MADSKTKRGFSASPDLSLNEDRPVSVVDIGSNSVRLVVYEGLKRSPVPIFNEKVICGLGRLVPSKGRMGRQSIERALRALRRFSAVVDLLDAHPMHVVATAAAREATDGLLFIAAAEEICGVPISVLSGQEEAGLAAAGVVAGVQSPRGIAGDLGGGSLELMNINNRKYKQWTTLPLGGLRLIEGGGSNFDSVRKIVDKELSKVDWLDAGQDRPFYAVGGTWRALARLHMRYRDYPLHVLHQYRIPAGEAMRYARYLQDMPMDFFGGSDDLSKSRVETVPHGAAVLQRLIKRIKPSEIVICATGIREGLLYNLLSKPAQKEDGFLETCRLLSDLRSRSPEYAQDLCDWTGHLFRALKLKESSSDKRLRHAACLVSDVGWRSHPDYRSEQSVAVLENVASTSIDHSGIAFMSLVIYYRHEGLVRDAFSSRFRSLIPRETHKRARILGASIRAAHAVGVGAPGVLPKVTVRVKGMTLFLKLPKKQRNIDGERLQRRFKLLAREVGLGFDMATSGD